MGLSKPEDASTVKAAATEFVKLCVANGLTSQQMIQAAICVATSSIVQEAGTDLNYALELAKRLDRSLRSAILAMTPKG